MAKNLQSLRVNPADPDEKQIRVEQSGPIMPISSAAAMAVTGRAPAPRALMERQKTLSVEIPESLRRAIAIRAAETGEPLRSIALRAFRAIGFEVAEAEIADRRGGAR
jgi:hypothetical protein